MEAVIHRPPRLVGLARSRWWLDGLRQAVPWLKRLSLPGVYKILRRFKLHYKRGRRYVHSPDLAYDEKLALIEHARALAHGAPKHFALLYQDELTYYAWPSVAQGYARACSDQPHARQGLRSNRKRRIAGALDVRTGRLFTWQRAKFDRHTLSRYFKALDAEYPDVDLIFVVLDNWPLHFHPDVLAALVNTKIVLLPLPTYAPWTNPIEKVWRKLYQELLHQHDLADRWSDLQTLVQAWLDQYARASTDLLHYVGL